MLTGFMHVMSFLGSAAFYLPVLAVVFWCLSPRDGARAAVLLTVGSALNTALKLVFQDPRPFWTDPGVKGREVLTSYGMPSGHAQGAIVAYGLASTRTRRRALWAAALAVVALVGVSRVYLGVHSVGQVLAGYAIGAALLAGALLLEPIVPPWWTRRRLVTQLMLSVLVALAFLAPMGAAVRSVAGGRLPAGWERAIESAGGTVGPITLSPGARTAGLLCGVLAGLSLLARRGWFEAPGPVRHQLARIAIGVGGVLALSPLALLGPHPALDFCTQTLVGLWVIAGAPEVFVRLRLAGRTVPVDGERARQAVHP